MSQSLLIHHLAAQTGQLDSECFAKTSKTGLQPHEYNPHIQVQEWAG